PKETGMRIAIAEIGPMPGSTPTTVPSSTPRRAKARLAGSSAEAKPPPRSMRVSISVPLTQDPDRQIHGEPVDEGNVDHECEADGEDEVADPLLRRVDAGHPHEEGHGREQEADRDEDSQVDEEERELEHDLPRRGFRRGLRGRSTGRLIRGRRLPRRGDRTSAGPCLGAVAEEAEADGRAADARGDGARSDDVRGLLDGERRDVVDRADDGDGAAGDEIGAVSGHLLLPRSVSFTPSSTVFAASST